MTIYEILQYLKKGLYKRKEILQDLHESRMNYYVIPALKKQIRIGKGFICLIPEIDLKSPFFQCEFDKVMLKQIARLIEVKHMN